MDKIICIGKNFPEHAREVGLAMDGEPVLFLKPPSVLRESAVKGCVLELSLPPDATSIEHECEVAVRLGRDGYLMTPNEASAAIASFTIGLDMTRRDLQMASKTKGEPWTVSKVFIDSAVVGPWIDATEFSSYVGRPFHFFVGETLRQTGTIGQMILSPGQCVSLASQYFPLKKGDLVFTGSPAGTGRVMAENEGRLEWGDIFYSVRWRSHGSSTDKLGGTTSV